LELKFEETPNYDAMVSLL